jgi:hypothetical protein
MSSESSEANQPASVQKLSVMVPRPRPHPVKSKMMASESSEANQLVQKPSVTVPRPRPRPVKSKMIASESSEANQPAQKPSVPRPRPVAKKANSEVNQPASVPRPHQHPVTKKANLGVDSSMVSGNAQETTLDKGNKKRVNPVGDSDEDGNTIDLATPVRPAKKVKSSAQTARPLRRTGICFISNHMLLPEIWVPNKMNARNIDHGHGSTYR